MFSITQNKGFQITFANGNTVSIQWGAGNYCGNYSTDIAGQYNMKLPEGYQYKAAPNSATAEIAVWRADGEWITKDAPIWDGDDYHDDVFGYATPDQVAQVIEWASK